MENKFKKGLILGGLLMLGSAIAVALTKDGKELTEEMQTELKQLSKKLQKKLGEMEDITKESFNSLAAVVVEEYAEKKALAEDVKDSYILALQKKWSEMEAEYSDEEINEK